MGKAYVHQILNVSRVSPNYCSGIQQNEAPLSLCPEACLYKPTDLVVYPGGTEALISQK